MYAIVNIAGKQFKVKEGQSLYVHRLAQEEGENVEFGDVLLLDNEEGGVSVGKPHVEGATVTAKVLTHLKDDKIIVFKKKRRKGYRKKNGHRQHLSKIQIETINA
ncbi:MAG: 50S ribosomal protein L21 [Bacteroidota bacterium]